MQGLRLAKAEAESFRPMLRCAASAHSLETPYPLLHSCEILVLASSFREHIQCETPNGKCHTPEPLKPTIPKPMHQDPRSISPKVPST